MQQKTNNLKHVAIFMHSLEFFLHPLLVQQTWHTSDMKYMLLQLAGLPLLWLGYGMQGRFQSMELISHPPVRRSLDHTGRTPCRPLCNGRPLSVRYWEAAARGTNPNLLLRTESQHTSVDSNHSSARRDSLLSKRFKLTAERQLFTDRVVSVSSASVGNEWNYI